MQVTPIISLLLIYLKFQCSRKQLLKNPITIAVIFLLVVSQLLATTWDEPWRKVILQQAEHFVSITVKYFNYQVLM